MVQWRQQTPEMIVADDGQGALLVIVARSPALGGNGRPYWQLGGNNYGEHTFHSSEALARAGAEHWLSTGERAPSDFEF